MYQDFFKKSILLYYTSWRVLRYEQTQRNAIELNNGIRADVKKKGKIKITAAQKICLSLDDEI